MWLSLPTAWRMYDQRLSFSCFTRGGGVRVACGIPLAGAEGERKIYQPVFKLQSLHPPLLAVLPLTSSHPLAAYPSRSCASGAVSVPLETMELYKLTSWTELQSSTHPASRYCLLSQPGDFRGEEPSLTHVCLYSWFYILPISCPLYYLPTFTTKKKCTNIPCEQTI